MFKVFGIALISLSVIFPLVTSQVFPVQYFFPRETDAVAVNGSNSTGRCSNFVRSRTRQICWTPTSSVLFDGNVPTLDGDMWASQLLTINETANAAEITFDFTDTPDYTGMGRLEVVMFNCPEWGISVRTISLSDTTSTSSESRRFLTSISPTTTSCNSLLRVCIPFTDSSIRRVFILVFTPPSTSNWVHLAEVTLYASGSTCPPDTIITPPPTTPPLEELTTPLNGVTSPDTSEIGIGSTSAAQEPSGGSSTGIIVAVVVIIIIIIVIIIAVVVIVILVLRSKQKKKDFNGNLPNSKGGDDTLVKMGDVEMSGKFTKPGMNDDIYHKGGEFGGEIGMGASKSRYDKTGETYSAVNDAGRSYSAVGAGESDQLYNQLRANEKKQQNLADQTYSVLQREEELTASQPGSVIEAAIPVYSDADSNHEWRHTSPSDVYTQVDKSKGKPKKPKPIKKQEVLEEYAMIGTTGAPEIPNKSRSLLKDLDSKPPNPSPSKLSALSNLAIPSDSLSVNPLYDSAGGTYEEGIMDNVYAEPGAATIQEPNPGGNIYETIYSESLNPSSFLREVGPDESQYSDELCPYSSIYSVPLVNTDEKLLEVTARNIQKIKILGSGNFGEVLLAKTIGLSCRDLGISQSTDTNVMVQVAVKMLKANASDNTKKDFEKEYRFMSRLNDPNVIRLLGICVTGTSFIMMEYMENGDLNQFLKKFETVVDWSVSSNVDITRSTLVYICTQIASAMKYLASKNFVHRDLATRNCLVGENFHVKISDFGMSRSLYESHYYIICGHAILPIRWMATECFYGKFSAKTDVWAFGATMWEVFVLSKYEPYYEFDDRQLVADACKGPNRTLLSRPRECPVNVYQIMTRCWVHDPSQRATFEELYEMLSSIKQL